MTDDSTFSRRTALGGTAALGLGLPLLAACGSGDDGGSDAETPKSGTVLTTTGEVPVGGGVILAKDGLVVTQPEEGTFKAFSSKCTHQGCEVTKVTDGTIDCPCHGSKFSISDGSVQAGPASSALPETTVTVDGQDIVSA